MSLILVIASILILLVLIILFKVNAFISFIVVSVLLGIVSGFPPGEVVLSIQKGIGDTLGTLVLILGFGAMLGKLIADSGAAQRIASVLVSLFGLKYIQWAMVFTGFIVGIPLFYNAGFVVLIPIVFTIAASTGLPLLYVGIPMIASLSVTHGLLPPHPSPVAIAGMFGADTGKILIYGIIIAIPVIIVAGPIFSRTLKKIRASPIREFVNPITLKDHETPGIGISLLSTLMPLILIGGSSVMKMIVNGEGPAGSIFRFIGDPVIAMLISLLAAVYLLGLSRGKKMVDLMDSLGQSISAITMILLIIAGAGGFKQVLLDCNLSDDIASVLSKSNLSPIFLAWSLAALLRICVGSATVAGLTTAGIILPLASGGTVNKELLVLAIGSGSLILSHVNDGGFWMFKEYFSLTIKETLLSWTVMETLISILGLAGVLLLNIIIR